MSEKRAKRRQAMTGAVTVQWAEEAGGYFKLKGTWVDLSEAGGGIRLGQAVKAGTMVKLESELLRPSGLARVRSCRQAGMGYRIGVEFVSGTRAEPVGG